PPRGRYRRAPDAPHPPRPADQRRRPGHGRLPPPARPGDPRAPRTALRRSRHATGAAGRRRARRLHRRHGRERLRPRQRGRRRLPRRDRSPAQPHDGSPLMAKPKRRSLSERNAEAIAGAVDNTSTREDGGAEQPPAPQPPAPAPADRPAAVSPAPPASEEPTRRSSVYLTPDDLRDVRSAYIVDFDHRPGSPGSFGLWAAGAIGELAALTVDERQTVRESLGPAGAGANRSQQLLVPDDVADAVGDAMRQDRLAGVVD